jgi:hypothetical protein
MEEREMNELIRFEAPNYNARMKLVESLNELGYGTRIVEIRDKLIITRSKIYVIVYQAKEKERNEVTRIFNR